MVVGARKSLFAWSAHAWPKVEPMVSVSSEQTMSPFVLVVRSPPFPKEEQSSVEMFNPPVCTTSPSVVLVPVESKAVV